MTNLGAPTLLKELPALRAPELFGSRFRTALLMLVATLEESYPAELARYLKTSVANVLRTTDRLEEIGVIVGRPMVVRVISLNPRYHGARELRELLLKLIEAYPEYSLIRDSRRTRPRRRGKPL